MRFFRRLIYLCCLSLVLSCGPDSSQLVEFYTVKRGEFVNSVTETGELEAVHATVIQAPNISWRFGALKVMFLVEDGTEVKEGDILIQFDANEVHKSISEAQAEMEIAEAELRKAKVKQTSEIDELEANLQIAQLNHRISQLKLEQAAFEADIDRKKIELDLDKSSIALGKATQEVDNKRRIHRQELNKLELKVKQALSKLEEANETLEKLTVKAPAPGIAIIRRNWSTNQKFQVDDQAYPSWPMIGLPDLSTMKSQIMINEVDVAKIQTGQEVLIRMDAFPENTFKGHITEVAALGRDKSRDSKVKVFDVVALIDEQTEQLMPGMTVSAEIIVDRIPDVLYVPIDAIFIREGQNIVYVRKGSTYEPREVVPGPENDNYVIIEKGLDVDDQVALADPTLNPTNRQQAGDNKTDAPPTASGR